MYVQGFSLSVYLCFLFLRGRLWKVLTAPLGAITSQCFSRAIFMARASVEAAYVTLLDTPVSLLCYFSATFSLLRYYVSLEDGTAIHGC